MLDSACAAVCATRRASLCALTRLCAAELPADEASVTFDVVADSTAATALASLGSSMVYKPERDRQKRSAHHRSSS